MVMASNPENIFGVNKKVDSDGGHSSPSLCKGLELGAGIYYQGWPLVTLLDELPSLSLARSLSRASRALSLVLYNLERYERAAADSCHATG
jgi:hypothetical protein